MKKQHPIDEYFKEGLEGHKTAPSEAVWEKINAEVQPSESQRSGGWYMMRAAVVLLLVGTSSFFYFSNNEDTLMNPVAAEEVENNNSGEKKEQAAEDKSTKPEKETTPASQKEPAKKPEKKQRKAIPLVHPNASSHPVMVNNQAGPEVVDESLLTDEEEMRLTAKLDVNEVQENKPGLKVKMKLNPATARAFYAQSKPQPELPQEDKDLREKVFAYATDQIDNLRSGRKLELPKAERKPQFEINLDKIF